MANDDMKKAVGVRRLTPTYVLVMMQLDAVNAKKDELTLTIKSLADTTRQLARAYAQHTRTIQALQQRVAKLEGEGEAK